MILRRHEHARAHENTCEQMQNTRARTSKNIHAKHAHTRAHSKHARTQAKHAHKHAKHARAQAKHTCNAGTKEMDGGVGRADLNAMPSSLSGLAWKAIRQAPATPHNTRRNVSTKTSDVSAFKIKPPKRASDSLPRLLLVYASTGPSAATTCGPQTASSRAG